MGQIEKVRKRVVIVDDSRTMQAFLEALLTKNLNFEVVGVAGDGETAIKLARRLHPDLITIDLVMPYINGRELLKELEPFPDMRKVVISASACESLAIKAGLERLGADGCISKQEMSRDPDGFCRALMAILRSPKKVTMASQSAARVDNVAVARYPLPLDERARLGALSTLNLANDDPDHRLDLLTEHLVKTTSFSACVMTFIDQHTQWIKSGFGLDRGSTARSQAICNYTICGDEPFIVHDTTTDKRFATLDTVLTGPMIRSYVGCPIIASTGVRLGAMCLLDTKPRRVSFKDLANLQGMALIAAELIESVPLTKERAA